MKARIVLSLSVLLMFGMAMETMAQRGQRGNRGGGERNPQMVCQNIPDLTEEQQSQIQSLRTTQLQRSVEHKAAMGELRAKKRSLMIAENANMNEVDGVIDQMSVLRSEHQKAAAAHRQSVRSVLTAEQRVYFDSRAGQRGQRVQGNRQGRGQGQGRPAANCPMGRW